MNKRPVIAGLLMTCWMTLGTTCIPIPGSTVPDDAEKRTTESFVGGDSDRLVFLRCDNLIYYDGFGDFPNVRQVYASLVAVDPATLGLTEIFASNGTQGNGIYTPYSYLSTDGQRIAFNLPHGVAVYDIDADTTKLIPIVINPADNEIVPGNLDWPYLALSAYPGDRVLNVASGKAQDPAGADAMFARLTAVCNHRAAYVETDQYVDSRLDPTSGQLMLLDLDSGDTTFLADVQSVRHIWLLQDRLVWKEGRLIKSYDLSSGATSSLLQLPAYNDAIQFDVPDVSEAGLLVHRSQHLPDTLESLELTGFDNQTTAIDSCGSGETGCRITDMHFAGPLIVYRRSGVWIVFDTRDNTSRHVQPFSTSPP